MGWFKEKWDACFGAEKPVQSVHVGVSKPVETPKAEPPKEAKKSAPEWEEIASEGVRILFKTISTGRASDNEIKRARDKAQRRAIRHFRGKEVKHRVVRKSDKEIEMSFYRRSGFGPVKFAFKKEPFELGVSKTGLA